MIKKCLFTAAMIGLLVGLWFAAQAWTSNLSVSKVAVYGLKIVDSEEVISIARVPDSSPFKELNLEEIRARVIAHPYVKDAAINRDFPATLRITVEERKPAALLVASRMALLDEDKIVMPLRNREALREVVVISGLFNIPQIGDTLRNDGVDRAMQVVQATANADKLLYNLFSEIQVLHDGGLLAYTVDGGVPVMFGSEVSAKKLISFKEFWLEEAAPAGSDQIQSIDLRYDGQIITRWRTSGVIH